MNRLNEIRKRIVSTEIPMRLCVFNMMSIIGIIGGVVSLITTYLMDIQSGQVTSMLLAVVLLLLFQYMANVLHKLNLAAILLCSIIGFVVFPLMFLHGGGIYSGMPVWFMLDLVFLAILIEGKIKFLIGAITLGIYSFLVYYAYKFPDKLTYFASEEMIYMDMGQSLIFVGLCIICIISFQVYMYDLAYKKIGEAKNEAEKAKEDALAANAAKSSFLANMSHEIRTPIGVIIGMNEMIQRDSNQDVIKDYSRDVSSSAKTLLSIINDILDFSKIESGKMTIVNYEYETMSLLRDIMEIAKVKKEETNIEFEAKIDDKLPKKLLGDDLRIKECLINIVTNAFKYTEKGKVTFRVTGERIDDVERITFSVEDTGRGIKEEEMAKLFESFVRLDEKNNRNIQGTGLGLNITNRLLELMNSKLEVESVYNEGSRFYFTIEQQITDDTPISDNNKNLDEQKKGYQPGLTAEDAHILVVDDSKVNLKVFCALLKQTKINIDTAISGMDSIEMVRNNHYDMIFMDHMMPGMDGEETLLKMKEEDLLGNTPIVMLTANAIVGMKEHFLEIGFTEYLSKPIEFKKLEEILIKYL